MKFPYAVKYNGKYYPPNAEIPEKEATPKKEVKKPTKAKKVVKGDKDEKDS